MSLAPDKAQAEASAAYPARDQVAEPNDNDVDGNRDAEVFPDSSVTFDASNFELDAFAMASLQTTASTILAAQNQQQNNDSGLSAGSAFSGTVSGSESDAAASRTVSPSGRQVLRNPVSLARRPSAGADKTHHAERHMWSADETQALVDGCNRHGVGNWKAMMNDEELAQSFKGRTPGDLKDRFRTYFPDAYHDLYPNAKTHTSRAVRSKAPDGKSIFEKGKTKERRPFNAAEDEVLKQGYAQHGSHWAIIAREPVFEGRRKPTDLRDRFRNAFPNLYEQAGYKPRVKMSRKERRESSGSFSQTERPTLLMSEASNKHEEQAVDRPNPPSRSETSTSAASAHSQAVSEYSEDEYGEEGLGMNDQISGRHPGRHRGSTSDESAEHSHPSVERSSSETHARHSVEESNNGTGFQSTLKADAAGESTTSSIGTSGPSYPGLPRQSLRRSQSSGKRASVKINSLDHAVKSASIKCNREALLASHQHAHYHHQHHLPHQQYISDGRANGFQSGQGNPTNATSNGNEQWTSDFVFDRSSNVSTASDGLTGMDLDQINELIGTQNAASLLEVAQSGGFANNDADQQMAIVSEGTSTSAQSALLASLLQQWDAAEQTGSLNRQGMFDSFQAYLDPVGPTYAGAVSQASLWTPVSSSGAPAVSAASPASASRREHEHNQWAGDLLHRGNTDAFLLNPHDFVTMANAQQSIGQTVPQVIPPSSVISGNSDPGVNDTRPSIGDHSFALPTMQDFISQSSEQVSRIPARASNESIEGQSGDSLLQNAYRSPFSYPADDLSLINPGLGGNMTLFPSLTGSGPASDGAMPPIQRRRRSTDTLRESTAFSQPQIWRGLSDVVFNNHSTAETQAQQSDEQPFSLHSGDHSRSLSSVASGTEEDEDVPSRAASVGKIDLVGDSRVQGLYAESLPDLSSGTFGDPSSASASDSTFANLPQLQMSYDDMDLPSFLNRSPSFAHVMAAGNGAGSNALGSLASTSPRLSLATDGSWSKALSGRGQGPIQGKDQRETTGDTFQRATSVPDAGLPTLQSDRTTGGDILSVLGERQSGASSGALGDVGPFTGQALFSNRMNDAGSLDRLEHLYLEGLHTPGSPMSISTVYQQSGSGGTGSFEHEQQRWQTQTQAQQRQQRNGVVSRESKNSRPRTPTNRSPAPLHQQTASVPSDRGRR